MRLGGLGGGRRQDWVDQGKGKIGKVEGAREEGREGEILNRSEAKL